MNKIRIGIVGTGAVGTAVAMNAVLSGIADEILLMNRRREKAEAEAMDICHAITFQSRYCYVHAGEYNECGNLDLIVITAAAPLVQGQTRLDMLDTAKKITASIVPPIMESGFDGRSTRTNAWAARSAPRSVPRALSRERRTNCCVRWKIVG